MNPEQQQDAWLKRLAENDSSALKEIMRAYSKQLGHVAMGVVKRIDLAEEVVADVFVNLWKRRDSIQTQSSLGAYLFIAVRNRALNYHKKNKGVTLEINEDLPQIIDESARVESLVMKNEMETRLDFAPQAFMGSMTLRINGSICRNCQIRI